MIATKLHLTTRKKTNYRCTGVLIQEYNQKTQKMGHFNPKTQAGHTKKG